jgi:hypothetical protein
MVAVFPAAMRQEMLNLRFSPPPSDSPPPPGIWPPEAAVFGHRSWPNTPPYGGQGLAAGIILYNWALEGPIIRIMRPKLHSCVAPGATQEFV